MSLMRAEFAAKAAPTSYPVNSWSPEPYAPFVDKQGDEIVVGWWDEHHNEWGIVITNE